MNLPSAIGEFADMLAVGSNALDKLVQRDAHDGANGDAGAGALLRETQDIARRLSAIADELRRHADSFHSHS